MTRSDVEGKARDVAKKKARALLKKFSISVEVVPAREIASAQATVVGSKYSVTVKRSHNAAQAFAFQYSGTPYEKENHVAPSTRDVMRAALATPQSAKFFTTEERQAFSAT